MFCLCVCLSVRYRIFPTPAIRKCMTWYTDMHMYTCIYECMYLFNLWLRLTVVLQFLFVVVLHTVELYAFVLLIYIVAHSMHDSWRFPHQRYVPFFVLDELY